MLKRIDELKVILQQAAYLGISGFLLGIELQELTTEIHSPVWLRKVWRFREGVLHFLLGTLLNSFAIFYFKSASALSSFLFIAVLAAVLTLNEFGKFGKSQTQVHVAFWSLCLISFSATLSPIVFGFIGWIPFLTAALCSGCVTALLYRWLRHHFTLAPRLGLTHVLAPSALIQGAFIFLYVAGLIPPVPLSVRYMGIYHRAEKQEDGDYRLEFTRPLWKIWQHGDQTFLARPGDEIVCYAQIFSPARFRDELKIRWLYHDERRGWQSWDAIPFPVSGGREEGYRGTTRKANYQPGEWRVQVETSDGREVGRIHFTVEADPDTGDRDLHTDQR